MKVERIRSENFDNLRGDTQADIVRAISSRTGKFEEDVWAKVGGVGIRVNVVLVSPKKLLAKTPGYPINDDVVNEYIEAWASGADFPPIIIDSSAKEPLIEGGHRTVSAARAGVKKIRAVDLAGHKFSQQG